MANRVLRDWTESHKINKISVHSERFFVRLIMKVDDFGCFHADTRLLKANLYPLQLDQIREADISRWMTECQNSGLIILYEHESKKYLQILDFRQRLDRAKNKYPLPNANESLSIDNDFPPETETKQKQESEREITHVKNFNEKSQGSLEEYFSSLLNGDSFNLALRQTNESEESLKGFLNSFREDCERSYPTFNKFYYHFVNWVKKKKEKSSAKKETKFQTLTKSNKAAHDLIDAKYANGNYDNRT